MLLLMSHILLVTFPISLLCLEYLIIEALAQATGILAFKSEVGKPQTGQIYMLVGVDKVRFKRMVEPGDQLEIYAEIITVKRGHMEIQL